MRTPALPGRTQQVLVLLPAGYHAHPRRRYPVLYLLHGAPLGSPQDFLNVDRLQVVASVLRARRRMRPLILVMPEGAPRFFWTGWVNATGRSGHWERYVARDVVHTVDNRFRTIAGSAGRGIGGLSAGAYGALDIALHHPREFGLIESWSGYMHADDSAKVLGGQAMIARDSPAWLVAREAPLLRRLGTYIWFYVGAGDHYAPQNRAFAAELRRLGIPHRFFVRRGGHSWALWRRQTPAALTAASARLAHG